MSSLFFEDASADHSLLEKSSLVDTKPNNFTAPLTKTRNAAASTIVAIEEDSEDEDESCSMDDFFGLPPPNVDISRIIDKALTKTCNVKNKIDEELENVTDRIDSVAEKARRHRPNFIRGHINKIDDSDFDKVTGKLIYESEIAASNVKEQLAKTELEKPGFEQLKAMPNLKKIHLRKLNRIERAKTRGPGWFDMPATEMTEEVTNDLKILQMRSVLDPKHFYKKNDLKVLPKYFQIGTVQHSPLDYYNERHTRKNKKHSLLDEVMKDEAVVNYSKRKYQEIVARRDKYAHRKAMKKMKKLKKNKK